MIKGLLSSKTGFHLNQRDSMQRPHTWKILRYDYFNKYVYVVLYWDVLSVKVFDMF